MSTTTSDAARPAATVAAVPATDPVIVLEGVVKQFGPNRALDGLGLRVPGGKITVLLGPNGAGKTTAIRMITGAFAPDAGRVRVFGLDPEVDGDDVRARCGVVSAKPALYDRLSGLDNLRYSAELYGLGRGAAVDARIHEAAGRFGIDAGPRRPGRRLLHRHEDPPGARRAACCTGPSCCSTTSRPPGSTPSRRTPCSS